MNPAIKVPWVEVAYVSASDFPLAAMSRAEIYKWMMAVRDLRAQGSFDLPGSGSASFDFRLSEVPDAPPIGKYLPTELSHVTTPGLEFFGALDADGNLTTGDTVATVIVRVGRATSNIGTDDAQPVARYSGGSLYLGFSASLSQTEGDPKVLGQTAPVDPDFPVSSPVTCTFDGESVTMYGDATFTGAGELNITLPATNAWLTWGGKRDGSTGHFLTTSI